MVTRRLFMIVLGCAAFSGCSGEAPRVSVFPVHGTLKVDGKPLGNVILNLNAIDGAVPSAYCHVKPDGSFALTTYEDGDGAAPGTYNVELLTDAMAAEFTEIPPVKPKTVTVAGSAGATTTLDIDLEKSKDKPGVLRSDDGTPSSPGMGPAGT